MDSTNPVLCGFGMAIPFCAKVYFNALRAPSGSVVRAERLGATGVVGPVHVAGPGVVFITPDGGFGRVNEAMCRERVMVDRYRLRSECGRHVVEEVFVDPYHRGPWQAIGLEGWTIERAHDVLVWRDPSQWVPPSPSKPSTFDGAWNMVLRVSAPIGDAPMTLILRDRSVVAAFDATLYPARLKQPAPISLNPDGSVAFQLVTLASDSSHVVQEFKGTLVPEGRIAGTVTRRTSFMGRADSKIHEFCMARLSHTDRV